jgi:hypothetical protein
LAAERFIFSTEFLKKWPKACDGQGLGFRETLKILCLAKSPIMVKYQDNQRNSEYLNGQKPIFGQGPWNLRSSEIKGWLKVSSNKV